MRKRSDKTKLRYSRDLLKIALATLDQIARTPSLPNPERDADWKNCMNVSANLAGATAKLIRERM